MDTSKREPEAPQSKWSGAVRAARIQLGKDANGAILCLDAAIYVAAQTVKRHPGHILGMEQIEKLAVHFKINLDRSGHTGALPSEPMDRHEAEKFSQGRA